MFAENNKLYFPCQEKSHGERIFSVAEAIEKVAALLFRERLHARWASIPYGKVGPPCVRSVITDAHVAGNDKFLFNYLILKNH